MSDNMLATPGAPAVQPDAQAVASQPTAPAFQPSQADASNSMRGRSQEHVIRRRDAAGKEMEMLAKLANDPNPDSSEVSDYVKQLAKLEHMSGEEADRLLATIPGDPDGIRQWARVMFAAVMHQGVHAEAAFPVTQFPSPQEENQQ